MMQSWPLPIQLTGTFDPPLVVPLPTMSFEAFRAWTRSDDFPEQGRIDYLNGKDRRRYVA